MHAFCAHAAHHRLTFLCAISRTLCTAFAHHNLSTVYSPQSERRTLCQVFALDLDGLMGELTASHVHFVRCIKPNDALAPGAPDAGLVLDQLRFSGMLEAVALISSGYPGRIPFVEIHERFQGKLPDEIMRMSPGDFVRAIIDAVGIAPGEYQIGKSRLFFRTGGADFLKELQHADADEVRAALCTTSAPPSAPPLRRLHLCATSAPPLHHLCTTSAPPLHQRCTRCSAWSKHRCSSGGRAPR